MTLGNVFIILPNGHPTGHSSTTKSSIFSQYSQITSIEQRRQYKKDFENDFHEYKKLFENRQRITKLFSDLESQLRQVSNNEQRHKVSKVNCK